MPKLPTTGLHGALTWRYMLVTVSALLVIEIVLVIVVTRLSPPYAIAMQPDIYVMERLAATAAGYLEAGDLEGLNRWLQTMHEPMINMSTSGGWLRVSLAEFPRREEQALLIFRQGEGVIAITPSQSQFRTLRSIEELPGPLGSDLFRSLPPRPGANGVRTYAGSQSVAVSPIQQTDGALLGVLVLVNLAADRPPSLVEMAVFAGVSIVVITLAVALLGALFGSFAARFLVGRVEGLARTTAAWGVGDFSQPVAGTAVRDELDDLAHHLNRLRTQIQALLAEREGWAAQAERDRVARELHDSVKQQLFTIRMHLATAQTLERQSKPEAAQYVQSAAALTQHAQGELAAIIQVLHHTSEGEVALVARARELITQWSAQTGITVTTELDELVRLPMTAVHALTRVLQEALANVYKHSEARQVWVSLSCAGRQVRLEVADNGRGFDAATVQPGLGLISMRERVEALGGELHIASDDDGTRVTVALPSIEERP